MKHVDDGFPSRLQVLGFPDDIPYVHVDRAPDKEADERVKKIIRTLANIDYRKWGASGGDEIPWVSCDNEGQEEMDSYQIALEGRLQSSKEHPLILEHLAKFRSFVPSLALINHLVRKADEQSETIGSVCKDDVILAIAQAEYFESHARRMYGLVLGGLTASVKLASRILAGDVQDNFTARDVYKCGWSQLTTIESVEDACKVLTGKKWLRPERTQIDGQRGRPTVRYRINPKVYQWADI
ncbi:MAG: DUF3987 domain-containing protein [Candidatus Melainabacteria bacterium]|nr:DUF3987 domain-containing protein [Candidatus Melainabacteria bacterium]